jgi:hypothetical protein
MFLFPIIQQVVKSSCHVHGSMLRYWACSGIQKPDIAPAFMELTVSLGEKYSSKNHIHKK